MDLGPGKNPPGTHEAFEDRERVEQFKNKLFAYLRLHPKNYSGAARRFQTSRQNIVDFLAEHPEETAEEFDAHLDSIAELVILAASGKLDMENKDHKNFKIGDGLRLLKEFRPKEWGGKVTKSDDDSPPDPSAFLNQATNAGSYENKPRHIAANGLDLQPRRPYAIRSDDP